MNEQSTQLVIALSMDDGDAEGLNELTLQLKSEIGELGVERIGNVSAGEAPEGVKAADWVSIGQLAVTLAPTLIPPLFELLKSWVDRKPSTPVKVRIRVGKKTAQIEYDPTKTSEKELGVLVKTLSKSIKT